jgi:Zn-finger nucleic acid-binding protein
MIIGMNCRNCGAAMELFESRGYFFCRYCGTFHFPESTSDEGVRILGAGDRPADCPACKTPMAQALLDDTYPVHACANCRGVLVPRQAFARAVNSRRSWASGPPREPRPLNPRDLDRAMRCPFCAAKMETHPYYGPGNVVIDSCAACDVIWLDAGELRQIVDAPGRDRGSRDGSMARPSALGSVLDAADLQDLTSSEDPLTMLFRLLS